MDQRLLRHGSLPRRQPMTLMTLMTLMGALHHQYSYDAATSCSLVQGRAHASTRTLLHISTATKHYQTQSLPLWLVLEWLLIAAKVQTQHKPRFNCLLAARCSCSTGGSNSPITGVVHAGSGKKADVPTTQRWLAKGK